MLFDDAASVIRGSARRAGNRAVPRAERKPYPGLALLILRVAVIVCVVLTVFRSQCLNLAEQLSMPAASLESSSPLPSGGDTSTNSTAPATAEPAGVYSPTASPHALFAIVLRWLARPPQAELVRQVALLGLALMLCELLAAAIRIPLQLAGICNYASAYFRIRGPLPVATRNAGTAAQLPDDAGQDFFRAIFEAWAAPRRWRGNRAWVAFTLSARPEEPAQLGMAIVEPALGKVLARLLPRRRHPLPSNGAEAPMAGQPDGLLPTSQLGAIASAIGKVLRGLVPGTQVEHIEDPLAAALQPGHVVAWREIGLQLPSHYPLRLIDDVRGSKLFGPIAAAAQARSTNLLEVQIILRPANNWSLLHGWRGRATRLMLQLRCKEDYALSNDIRALEEKLDGTPYEANIRLIAVAAGQAAHHHAQAELDQIVAVLGQYGARIGNKRQRLRTLGRGCITLPPEAHRVSRSTDLRLRWLRARPPRCAPLPPGLLPLRPWRDPDILASAELGGLWHLPTADLSGLIHCLPYRHHPAPPHAFVEHRPERIVLGYAQRADGTQAPVGPSLNDMRQILHVTAGVGAGKTRLAANICAQLMPHGFTLLDGKGDDQEGSLVAVVRRLIRQEDEARTVIIDPLDSDWPVGLNPLANLDLARHAGLDQVVDQVLAIFARLDPSTWGKALGMQHFAQMATLLILQGEARPTLAHVKQALLSAEYRSRLLKKATDIDVRDFWMTTFASLSDQQRSSREALIRRLDMLLATETTRYAVTQARPRFTFADAIKQKWIVLCPIPDITLPGRAGALAMLIFQALVRAAATRCGTSLTRANYGLLIDEFQVLLGDCESGIQQDVQTALTRLRAYGIPAVYMHQALSQLGSLKEIMLQNAANRVILRTNEPDSSAYARAYAISGLSAAEISAQDPLQHQYVVCLVDGIPAGPFSTRPLPWPEPVEISSGTYTGPAWRTALPADSDPDIDPYLIHLVYGQHDDEQQIVARLTESSDIEWEALLQRWDAIRQAQRQHILNHPGCIPDRLERQRWLSRLQIASPRILAAAEYARARKAIGLR